jgi:hypothetical protein
LHRPVLRRFNVRRAARQRLTFVNGGDVTRAVPLPPLTIAVGG